jgi:uncharacterized protein
MTPVKKSAKTKSAKTVKPLETQTVPIKRENLWAMFCHLSTLSGFFIPMGNVIAPLIMWALLKDEMPLVDDQGKEALNFQISMLIYILVSLIFALILVGLLMILVLLVFDVLVTIIACVKSCEGNKYRYPLNLRIIK